MNIANYIPALIIVSGIVAVVGIVLEGITQPTVALRYWRNDEWQDKPIDPNNPWARFGR
jgi:hypothetical protein